MCDVADHDRFGFRAHAVNRFHFNTVEDAESAWSDEGRREPALPSLPIHQNLMRAIELFCGIGGFAAAAGGRCEIVAAVDINRDALAVYKHNFAHPTFTREIESLSSDWLAQWQADLWWMSPPCQPYTRRGKQRDLDDNRSASFVALVEQACRLKPSLIALENVPEFAESRALVHFKKRLHQVGYSFRQALFCPTDWGAPMRRRRFYLVASREPLNIGDDDLLIIGDDDLSLVGDNDSVAPPGSTKLLEPRSLGDFIAGTGADDLKVDQETLTKYAGALSMVNADDEAAVCNCFTSAYGRSPVRSGSLLKQGNEVRRFSPAEIAGLLGFPPDFQIPDSIPLARQWSLVGNSLAVDSVARVITWLPTGR